MIDTGCVRTAHGTFHKIPKHCSTIPSMSAESTSFVGVALQYSVLSVCGSSSRLWSAGKGRARLSVDNFYPSCWHLAARFQSEAYSAVVTSDYSMFQLARSILVKPFNAYSTALDCNPLTTKCLTSGVMYAGKFPPLLNLRCPVLLHGSV